MVTEGQDVKTVIYAYLILGFQGKHNYLNSVIYQKKEKHRQKHISSVSIESIQ